MASTYLSLHVHVIFATKDRHPLIADEWRNDLHAYIGGTVRGLGAQPLAVGGIRDHVHLLMTTKATHVLSDLLRETKKASSVWASERSAQFAWQIGYAAFSVGASDLEKVVAYVANQEAHHRTLTSEEELRQLLAEAGIAFDERYFG